MMNPLEMAGRVIGSRQVAIRPSRVCATMALLILAMTTSICGASFTAEAAVPPGAPVQSADPEHSTPSGFDITGSWTSVVTQNWRYRMVTPGPGEYEGIPINPQAKEFADHWGAAPDVAAGKQCEAYGAAAIMRIPEHLHVSWQDPGTLKVQTDAGMQTRLLLFNPTPAQSAAPPSLQGLSVAQWVVRAGPRGFGPPDPNAPRYGSLEVTTSDMSPGLLRKNGVPYSDRTRMAESWDVEPEPDGFEWLTITTQLSDPVYLRTPFSFTSIFLKESDGSKWHPQPCSLTD